MKNAFSRESLLSLDPEEFSDADKRVLIERFFPTQPIPEWKRKLRKGWNDGVRWDAYSGNKPLGDGGEPYRFTEHDLSDRAMYLPSRNKGNRVTDFTGWIYSLYLTRKDPQALCDGKTVERQVAAQISSVPENPDWEVIYVDPLDSTPKPLKISALKVNGKPLWGAPDLVFRNRHDGAVIIVERKASNKNIPCDGWPNLRAQLWAYAHIDDWIDTTKITLIGEVWGFVGNHISLRKVLRWDIKDEKFYAPNADLFEKYQKG